MIQTATLTAMIWNAGIIILLLIILFLLIFHQRRNESGRKRNPHFASRKILKKTTGKAKLKKHADGLILPGIRIIINASTTLNDNENNLDKTEVIEISEKWKKYLQNWINLKPGTEKSLKSITINMEDLLAADHPAAFLFFNITGTEPSEIPFSGIQFCISPEPVLEEIASGFKKAGLLQTGTPSSESDYTPHFMMNISLKKTDCNNACSHENISRTIDVPLLPMIAESALTATPVDILAQDQGYRLLADIQNNHIISEKRTDCPGSSGKEKSRDSIEVKSPGKNKDEESEITASKTAMKPDDPNNSKNGIISQGEPTSELHEFSGYYFLQKTDKDKNPVFVAAGRDFFKIAQRPSLLTGLSLAMKAFSPGTRLRVYSNRRNIIMLADSNAYDSDIMDCRRKAGILLDTVYGYREDSVSFDFLHVLGKESFGLFSIKHVNERFFEAADLALLARISSDFTGAATARAMMHLTLDNMQAARAHLEIVEEIAPENLEVLLALGTLLNETGDFCSAERILKKAVALDMENPAVNNNLGVTYQKLGRLLEAQIFFEKASIVKPEDAISRINLGRTKLETGDHSGAEICFREALKRDSRNLSAITGLVLVAMKEGDINLARDRLGTAISLEPGNPTLLKLHRELYPEEKKH